MLEYICKYFLIPLFNTLLCSVSPYILLRTEKVRKSFIILCITEFFIILLLYNFHSSFLPCCMLLILYFLFIEKIPPVKFTCTFLTFFLIVLISDALSGFIFEKIIGLDLTVLFSSTILFTLSNALVMIIDIILTLAIDKIINKINFSFKLIYINKSLKKLLYVTTLILILILYMYRVLAMKYMTNLPTIYISGAIILLLFSVIIYYYIMQAINMSLKKDFIDKENKQLKDYTHMLETMSSDLRKFKHDYVNILYTLGDFINNGDIEGLKDFYNNDLLPESKKIVKTDKNITLLRNIKVTPIKALVSSKLLSAQSEGIEINAEVLEEIDSLAIKTIDICRILGIFLDNAIEAALLCEKKFIHFAMIKTDEDIIIVILNSCPNDVPPVFKLFEKNFSTKGTNRGIGLSNVKEILSSNYKNILLNTSCNCGVFKQELIIKGF